MREHRDPFKELGEIIANEVIKNRAMHELTRTLVVASMLVNCALASAVIGFDSMAIYSTICTCCVLAYSAYLSHKI